MIMARLNSIRKQLPCRHTAGNSSNPSPIIALRVPSQDIHSNQPGPFSCSNSSPDKMPDAKGVHQEYITDPSEYHLPINKKALSKLVSISRWVKCHHFNNLVIQEGEKEKIHTGKLDPHICIMSQLLPIQ
jgi:hypothetical protein